ncbi:MAG TPA: acyl-CoA reductase [Candidatus Eremiobacteraceae bacterium]|nr:acyl-CoA reductase [Candidatus Eremiobacteraceae bacterium]
MIAVSERTALLASAAAQWRDPQSAVRREARAALLDGPWSQPVVETALDSALWDLDASRAAEFAPPTAPDPMPVLVVLPGNVIGPALASSFCAAIAGARAILKSAGPERALAPIVARQFDAIGPQFEGTIDARYWRGGDDAIEAEIFGAVRKIIVFGSDATCADVRARANHADVVSYGDAYSIGFIAAGADYRAAAADAAIDICIFDQRGCLSPQTIYVEGDAGSAVLFARALAGALEAAAEVYPLGKPDAEEPAQAAAWVRHLSVSAIAAVTHGLDTLVVGAERDGRPEYIIGVVPFGNPVCAGFGRIVAVMPCSAPPPLRRRGTLDTIGVAGVRTKLVHDTLRAAAPSRVCPLGAMQRPPFGYRPKPSDFA